MTAARLTSSRDGIAEGSIRH